MDLRAWDGFLATSYFLWTPLIFFSFRCFYVFDSILSGPKVLNERTGLVALAIVESLAHKTNPSLPNLTLLIFPSFIGPKMTFKIFLLRDIYSSTLFQ